MCGSLPSVPARVRAPRSDSSPLLTHMAPKSSAPTFPSPDKARCLYAVAQLRFHWQVVSEINLRALHAPVILEN